MLQSDGMAGSRFQATVVQQSIEETLTSILSPKRRVDILRDIIASKKQRRPYVIVFCGVNGESLLVKCGRLLGETPPPPPPRARVERLHVPVVNNFSGHHQRLSCSHPRPP